MTTIATIDLKNIHEIYEQIKVDFPDYSERFVYFLATCLYLDTDVNGNCSQAKTIWRLNRYRQLFVRHIP